MRSLDRESSPGMKIRDLPPQIVASFDESVDEADEQDQPEQMTIVPAGCGEI